MPYFGLLPVSHVQSTLRRTFPFHTVCIFQRLSIDGYDDFFDRPLKAVKIVNARRHASDNLEPQC